jgi:hypothetical protein
MLIFFKNRLNKSLFITFIFLIFIGCTKVDPATGEKVLNETDQTKRAADKAREGGGIFANITKDKSSNTYDFATSNILWRATLKNLNFLPLINADYSGGIIIYDWYSENLNSTEQIKVTVKFLNNEIRADSLEVTSHKKLCNENNKCFISKLNNNFSNEIKEKILSEARIMKIEEAKNKKD